MKRRAAIVMIGASISCLGGCASLGDGSGGGNATESVTDERDSPSGGQPAVEFYSYQPGIIRRATPETMGVFGGDGSSFLFVRIDAHDVQPSPDPASFRFSFDGETVTPLSPQDENDAHARGGNTDLQSYHVTRQVGWIAFELPDSGDSTDAHLSWPGGEWRPDEELRRRLSTAGPDLSMTANFPDTIQESSPPAISIEIQNTGEIPGRYVLVLNRNVPQFTELTVASDSKLVSSGETRTWDFTDSELPMDFLRDAEEASDSEVSVEYRLSSIPGSGTWEIPFEPS